jgi:hypothetical protein
MTPSSATLQSYLLNALPSRYRHDFGTMLQFVSSEMGDVARTWPQWQAGLLGGMNEVNGSGLGTWSGTGMGGKLEQTTPFDMVHSWPYDDPHGYWDVLKSAITQELMSQFGRYASSYTFATVPYTGSSGAGPTNPGPFSAVNTPGSLTAYKASAQTPNNIGQGIRGRLPSQWKADDVLLGFLNAYGAAIEQAFPQWEGSATLSGDTVEGTASAGSGSGSGTSDGTGKVS